VIAVAFNRELTKNAVVIINERRVNMNYLTEWYVKFVNSLRSEKGQTLVEYALILVLIAIVVIVILRGVGTTTSTVYSKINCALTNT
jgi:pilus assembly protein Flp/PilA